MLEVELLKLIPLKFFDRWGDLIFTADNFLPNDPSFGWNGAFRGEQLNAGVFVYYAEVLFEDGEVVSYQGDITLIR